jgi:iron-sulfur cluster repair protein YtfE (RIC family)
MADLRELEQVVRPGSAEGLAELRARLDATRSRIIEHFRSEEQNGYMDVVRKREPRLERSIQQLAEEHHQLARSLDVLIARTRATSLGDPLREAVREWIENVRQHESRETDLVQDAFSLDIGAED